MAVVNGELGGDLNVSYTDDVYTIERGPDAGGVGAVYRAFGETIRGLLVHAG